MINVNSSTTTLTFIAPSLPDGVFTGTVVVMVTAVNRLGIGPASAANAEIDGMYYVHIYIRMCIPCTCSYLNFKLL